MRRARPVGVLQPALLALDRHTGVVGNLLPAAGEQVEERRLAAVGVAHQRDQRAAPVHVDDGFAHGGAATELDAGRLGAAQREGGVADAHHQRICAGQAARHHHHPLAGNEADLLQPLSPIPAHRVARPRHERRRLGRSAPRRGSAAIAASASIRRGSGHSGGVRRARHARVVRDAARMVSPPSAGVVSQRCRGAARVLISHAPS